VFVIHSIAWITGPQYQRALNHRTTKPRCGIYSSSIKEKKCNDTNQIAFRLNINIEHYFDNRLTIIFRCFDKLMFILLKRCNIYIYDMVIVTSICVDNILLKMVVLTETCKGWKIKNTTFISHTGRWLRIFYTRGFFWGVKWLEHQTACSSPSTDEVLKYVGLIFMLRKHLYSICTESMRAGVSLQLMSQLCLNQSENM
jgi:hypothetical protein